MTRTAEEQAREIIDSLPGCVTICTGEDKQCQCRGIIASALSRIRREAFEEAALLAEETFDDSTIATALRARANE